MDTPYITSVLQRVRLLVFLLCPLFTYWNTLTNVGIPSVRPSVHPSTHPSIHPSIQGFLLHLDRFFSFLIPHTVGRNPGTEDQPVARLLSTNRTTQTQNKRTQTSSGIRTHDPNVRASEDSSYLRPRGHCDRRVGMLVDQYRCM
jgi:hypothetical protein